MGRLSEVPPEGQGPTATDRAAAKRRLLFPTDADTETPAAGDGPPPARTTSLPASGDADSVTFGPPVIEDEFAQDWYPDEEKVPVRERLERLRTSFVRTEPDTPTPPASPQTTGVVAWTRAHLRRVILVAAAVLVIAALGVWLTVRDRGPAPLTQKDVAAEIAKALDAQAKKDAARPSDGAVVWAAIRPSLVVITTGTSGLGAGTVVRDDGSILTSLHVVRGATSIQVRFADGTISPATISLATEAQDLAVLRPTTLPETVVPAVLGGGVAVGDQVFAVGHPLGYVGSVSAGVVSATNRSVTVAGLKLTGLIQTDTAINPGNSGGPLLNTAGQVVGVVTAITNPDDGDDSYAGIGFAVPIATAGGSVGAPPK